MKANFCQHEGAVLEAIEAGRWPLACDRELRDHAAQCPICADVLLVAQTLQQENLSARAEMALPAAGLVWWKAQLRAKRENATRAVAPIAIVERAAAIFGVVSVAALAVWRWDWVAGWFTWFANLSRVVAPHPTALPTANATSSLLGFSFLIVLSLGACLLLASLVLYLIFAEE
jgi:hypothetical protein